MSVIKHLKETTTLLFNSSLEEVLLPNTRHHMTELKDEQAGIQESEGDAVNHTSSHIKPKHLHTYTW